MNVVKKFNVDSDKFLEELRLLNWVGVSQATIDEPGNKTLFYSALIFQPEFLEKLLKDPSFGPGEMKNFLNVALAKFTVTLAACLRPAADGVPLDLRLLVNFSAAFDSLMAATVEDAESYESHRKSDAGNQDPPFFLRYDQVLVEERLFDVISESSLSGEVPTDKRVGELLQGLSSREQEVLGEQIYKIKNLVAELRLREATLDDISSQLADFFDDFYHKTEP